MHYSSLTVIMVAYKPKIDLLKSLICKFNTKYPIIIANNSEEKLEKNLYKLENLKIIDTEKNLGNGAGINRCLNSCNTNLALYLDIDVEFDNSSLEQLLNYSKKYDNFGVLVPNGQNKIYKDEIIKKWDMEGSVMLINKKTINNKVKFDESYFLYFEEIDFFFNCLKRGLNVFFIPRVKFKHNNASSIDEKKVGNLNKINLLREWHYMWSQFYFYKKNFSWFKALQKCLPFFFKDIMILIMSIFKFNLDKISFRSSRIFGFLSSLFNLKSKKRI